MFSNKNTKTAAIICEYNPFHNGHLYQIQKTRELTGAENIVALMSGDFIQRGEPAVFDKYIRTRMALSCGVDAVIELPVLYAVSSAEGFASGGVSLLNSLGCIDILSFGSESGNLDELKNIAEFLVNEPEEYKTILRSKLKEGYSFPVARSFALKSAKINSEILESPNNILAIEYLKALIRTKSSIVPFTIKRNDNGYNSTTPSDNSEFASAHSLRNLISLSHNGISARQAIQNYVPETILESYDTNPVFLKDFDELIYYSLLMNREKGYARYLDVSEELSSKIKNYLPQYHNSETFIGLLKSKNMTYSSISRALIHILLEITEKNFQSSKPDYARILGFKKEAQLLHLLKKSSSIPLITKLADATSNELLKLDIKAASLYSRVNHSYSNEFTSSPIVYTS